MISTSDSKDFEYNNQIQQYMKHKSKTKVRITSGKLKNRYIILPEKVDVEPTKGIVKEALFNILGQDVVGSEWLELFAGTGNVGFEAISRGAEAITFVDNNHIIIEKLNTNSDKLKISSTTHESDVILFLHQSNLSSVDYIFADPPYDYDHIFELLKIIDHKYKDAIFILEHSSKKSFSELELVNITCSDVRRYGLSTLSFFIPNENA